MLFRINIRVEDGRYADGFLIERAVPVAAAGKTPKAIAEDLRERTEQALTDYANGKEKTARAY